ncbi:hypothetical protein LEP1GSC016_3542 [Leptospira borgpetersenii serovar Hardjo-bovis str. Sponselee]|uniref:Uncharacterized protein n=2 Tax=Leptospira borgpetersenii TaxID=174 RepID=M6BHA3_LEPBO|nr:hypothetical protein LEP1GSC016_3542 [Leptospira borgpetersenii serovar Hardjo-bovis str. Sponselee]EMO60971.1 hypothetical protein LEP1GSC133_4040 [Leptospira borgpetersenii serovar Pomona str. 200901868]
MNPKEKGILRSKYKKRNFIVLGRFWVVWLPQKNRFLNTLKAFY